MKKRNSAAKDGLDETEDQLSLRDHLLALRRVVITCILAVAVGFVAAFYRRPAVCVYRWRSGGYEPPE